MFFQVLFAKTCSMKFAKRLEDRWIFASSGTVPFWVRESPPPGGRMFFQVLFEKTRSTKFAKRLEDRWIFASSGTVPFWVRESPLSGRRMLRRGNEEQKKKKKRERKRNGEKRQTKGNEGGKGKGKRPTRTGLATSRHHFTWPPPQHPATQQAKGEYIFVNSCFEDLIFCH